MTNENRRANALGELAAARDALKAADGLVAMSLRRDAASRAYYAVFHAARALLLLEGLEAKTHGGVHRLVAEQLVRTGKLDAKVNVLLARLQGVRHQSDHAYTFDIDEEDAAALVADARAFVEKAATLVGAAPLE